MNAAPAVTTEHPDHRFRAVAITDGTMRANDALTRATRLLPEDMAWHLATVVDPHPSLLIATAGATSVGGPVVSPAELDRQVVERRTAGASALATTVPVFEHAAVESVVLSGHGTAPIVEYVDEHGLELIVSPTPVRHANATDRYGDLADDLVGSSPVPLLVVPTGGEQPIGEGPATDAAIDPATDPAVEGSPDGITLVIAVDDTHLDQMIVEVALDVFDRPSKKHARDESASDETAGRGRRDVYGVVVHIDPDVDSILSFPFSSGVMGSGGAALAALTEQLDDEGRHAPRAASRVAEQVATRLGDDRTTAIGDVGDPADAILRLAEEHQADVIVVGTRNRSWFSRLFDPSVAGAVADRARRPVLVVRSELGTATK